MTVLQRRPREVYRVFDEDDFFLRGAGESRATPAMPLAAESRARRYVVAAALMAATGALGGLLAVANVLSVPGSRRRAGGRRFAATTPVGAWASSSTRAETVAVAPQPTLSRPSSHAGARERSRRVRPSHRPRLHARSALARRVVGPGRAPALTTVAPAAAATSVPAAAYGSLAPAGSEQPRPDGPEFGFER
jgi:hypothetical protein